MEFEIIVIKIENKHDPFNSMKRVIRENSMKSQTEDTDRCMYDRNVRRNVAGVHDILRALIKHSSPYGYRRRNSLRFLGIVTLPKDS